jgi:hypothetical protein
VLAPCGTVATICVSLHPLLLTVAEWLLNETVLPAGWVDWKPDPLIVTSVFTAPLAGEIEVICGPGTVKFTSALLRTPATFTVIDPLIAVGGTLITICVSDQLTTTGVAPRMEIVLVPCVAPKPLPFTWTCNCVPAGPLEGTSPLMSGPGYLYTTSELLVMLLTLTVTGPVEALLGALATILVSLHVLGVAEKPLKETVAPVGFVAWNPEPLMVTEVPDTPPVGEMLVICGAGTVK